MPIYTDQMGRDVDIPAKPKRIISLVPSQTELLFELGLGVEVIGITKFCIHPKDTCKIKNKIGGTKNLNIQLIKNLNPDLIIGNKEENEEKQIKELIQYYPVWMSDITNYHQALEMISEVGEIVNKKKSADKIVVNIKKEFSILTTQNEALGNIKVAYFIWKDPYMVAASNTFIDDMLKMSGWTNAFAHKQRYPEIERNELSEINPDVIFLSSEPYPFSEKHISIFKEICPTTKIWIVDGELFSWYGSRLIHSAKYFKSLQEKLSE